MKSWPRFQKTLIYRITDTYADMHTSTELQLRYHHVSPKTLQDWAHNLCQTLFCSITNRSETADGSWDLWINHSTKMTFLHSVWMSWGLIPSKAASPHEPVSHQTIPPLPPDTSESSRAPSSSAAMVIRRRNGELRLKVGWDRMPSVSREQGDKTPHSKTRTIHSAPQGALSCHERFIECTEDSIWAYFNKSGGQ